MQTMIITSEDKAVLSPYPEDMEKYFLEHDITIKVLPQELIPDLEKRYADFKVTSATQYINYLEQEINFWSEKDTTNILNDFSKANALKTAKQYFLTATSYFENNNNYYGKDHLNRSINAIKDGTLCSKTSLANKLLTYTDKSKFFIRGFRSGLMHNEGATVNNTVQDFEGFNAALIYKRKTRQAYNIPKNERDLLQKSVEEANENYARLNSTYTSAFYEQERRLADITNQSNEFLDGLKTQSEKYFAEREKQCNDLESLYSEKLQLQVPAKYWEDMEKEYRAKGAGWLIASIILAMATIAILVIVLFRLSNTYTDDSHWVDLVKNSAIITIITSIAVYMLRICVKLTTSSFHLSRDAKERNKLTFFYLSLIEQKGVSEKERAIVLNSLFSRSDTGLLKGDSSPSMSGNVTELVEKLQK